MKERKEVIMRFSDKAKSLEESLTLAISAKANELRKNGVDVINLAIGEPDFPTPDYIKKAGIQAIEENITTYTPVTGLPDLKKEIVKKYKNFNKMEVEESEIVVSTGAKQALMNAFFALLNPGDEVLIPVPYWLSYPEMTKIADGVPVLVTGDKNNNYKLRLEDLEEKLTDKTKVLILNNPSNPSGVLYSKEELEEIGNFAVKNDLFIVADEIYERLIYSDDEFYSIASLSREIYDRTVTVSGWSKSYAMTGWRLGYSVAPKELTTLMVRIQGHQTSNPCSISQMAGLAALRDEDDTIEKMISTFGERRNYMKRAFEELNLETLSMDGAFYTFFNIKKYLGKTMNGQKIEGSLDFCQVLLEEAHIAAVPGLVFGLDDYVRFSYAVSLEDLEKAMERLQKFIGE